MCLSAKYEGMRWNCRGRIVDVSRKTHIMGILNVTPDSFSDGGEYFDRETAIAHATEMYEAGADIIDIGGESTRPGAEPVSAEEEIERTAPVVEEVVRRTECLVSIDTMKAGTAQAALRSGAHIVNDVSAGSRDSDMPKVVADHGAGVVLMHMLGNPRTMQRAPRYENVVEDVREYLSGRIEIFVSAGADREQIAVDPGIGFGKTVEHNLDLIRNIGRLKALDRPLLLGASRKSFIGKLLDIEAHERKSASLGVEAYGIMAGADIIRVHDVKDSCQVARIVDILRLI